MSNVDASNVTTGKPKIGGAVWSATAGAALPTDAKTQLDKAFSSLGYCSEDGFINDFSSSKEPIKAWGGVVVGYTDEKFEDGFTVGYIESLNPNVLKEVFGQDQVTGDLDSGMTAKLKEGPKGYRSLVVEMVLAEGTVLKRVVVPKCMLEKVDKVTYSDEDAVVYNCTYKAEKDSDGFYHHEYFVKKGE